MPQAGARDARRVPRIPPAAEAPRGTIDPAGQVDPVAAVLDAHGRGRRLALRTSGTTGSPRWVVRTTQSWWASFPAYGDLAGIDASSQVWVPGPLTATMNLFAAVHARASGADLLHDAAAPGPGVTHAVLTPAQLVQLSGALPRRVHVIVAGDRLAPPLAASVSTRGGEVSHYYGASELSFVGWGAHAEDLRPFPGVEVVSRDGVLWSRSAFHADGLADADGWASVGDRGTVEETSEGLRIHVDGRAEQAITTAGATVMTSEVEHVLAAAATARVAVVGLPHERLGQIVAAVIEQPSDLSQLRRAAQASLDDAARPRVWFAGPAPWPTTVKGETDRRRLATEAQSGVLRRLTRA